MAVKYIVIWGLTAMAASLLAGIVAAAKNRDVSYWMGWSFVLPPMVIALFLIPALKEPRARRPSDDDDDSSDR
jgi:hypothetical protein